MQDSQTRVESAPGPAVSEVLAGVEAAARAIVQFDRIGLVLHDAGVVTIAVPGTLPGAWARVQSRDDFSPRLWPVREAGQSLAADASRDLDPTCAADSALIDSGIRSLVALPLRSGAEEFGVLWFGSHAAVAFSDQQAAALQPVSRLLALALERERLWTRERDRRRKHEVLEALLPTIAAALDVRTVFSQVSDTIQEVIPHVTVSLALLSPDGRGVKVHVASNYDVGDLPEYRFTAEGETIRPDWRSFVTYDCQVLSEGVVRMRISPAGAPPEFTELRPGPIWTRILSRMGIRSLLRVPVRVKDEPVGAISFGGGRPFSYGPDDVLLATRIADHVALALAHERLAEEGRRTARAQERASYLQDRVETLVQELEHRGAHRALGESAPWKAALLQATRVAGTDTTVLITGESGTGKEVVARYIHRASKRTKGPFVALNCAALPEQLLESELFGYERGAFTGAHVSRAGKIEQAAGGVLFLDEVGEMTPPVQAKFLRVLQEREFQRLGGTKTLKADVRVIAATNRDPRLAIERGTLREDLYYRLGVFEIALPALRDRRSDIMLLADAFLEEIARTIGRPAAGLSEDARDHLLRHRWPGNIRELRNAIERAVILCDGGLVTSDHLPITIAPAAIRPAVSAPAATPSAVAAATMDAAAPAAPPAFPSEGVSLETVQRDLIEKALARARNNKSQAAKLLGVPRGQLYSLLRRHGLTEARR